MGKVYSLAANFNVKALKSVSSRVSKLNLETSERINISDDVSKEEEINRIVASTLGGFNTEDNENINFQTNNSKKQACLEAINNALQALDNVSLSDDISKPGYNNSVFKDKCKDVITLCSYLERDRAKSQGGEKFTSFIKLVRHTFEAQLSILEGNNRDKVTAKFANDMEHINDTTWDKIKKHLSRPTLPSLFGGATAGVAIDVGAKVGVGAAVGSTVITKVLSIIGLVVAGLGVIGIHGAAAVGIAYASPVIVGGLLVGGGVKAGHSIYRHHKESKALDRLKVESNSLILDSDSLETPLNQSKLDSLSQDGSSDPMDDSFTVSPLSLNSSLSSNTPIATKSSNNVNDLNRRKNSTARQLSFGDESTITSSTSQGGSTEIGNNVKKASSFSSTWGVTGQFSKTNDKKITRSQSSTNVDDNLLDGGKMEETIESDTTSGNKPTISQSTTAKTKPQRSYSFGDLKFNFAGGITGYNNPSTITHTLNSLSKAENSASDSLSSDSEIDIDGTTLPLNHRASFTSSINLDEKLV